MKPHISRPTTLVGVIVILIILNRGMDFYGINIGPQKQEAQTKGEGGASQSFEVGTKVIDTKYSKH